MIAGDARTKGPVEQTTRNYYSTGAGRVRGIITTGKQTHGRTEQSLVLVAGLDLGVSFGKEQRL